MFMVTLLIFYKSPSYPHTHTQHNRRETLGIRIETNLIFLFGNSCAHCETMSSYHTCCNREKVKRGLWSPEEDEKLINYVSTYGHGCWSTVPRLAGLQRCGKSCRLRWINYLRPDVKRGNFTPQEAALIIELHRILGNRWSQIAKYLPGRTDNEVKNFWNSSIKKKLLAHARNCRSSDLYFAARFNQNLPNFTDGSCSSSSSSPETPIAIQNPQIDRLFIPMESRSDMMMTNHEYDSNFGQFYPSMMDSSSLFGQNPNQQQSEQDENSMDDSNFFNYSNQEIPTYDFDKETLEALLLELNPDKSNIPMSLEAPLFNMVQENGFSFVSGPGHEEPILHPYHIDNIAAMMENFASPTTSRDLL